MSPQRIEELLTARLRLRPFDMGDRAFIVSLLNEEDFLRHIGDKDVRNEADAADYLQNGPIVSYAKNGFGLMLVEDVSTRSRLGMCGLILRDNQPHPDIGYAFLAAQHGRGYALEAARAVLEHAQCSLKIGTLLAFVNPDNDRSISLLEKLGMRYRGLTAIEGIAGAQKTYIIGNAS